MKQKNIKSLTLHTETLVKIISHEHIMVVYIFSLFCAMFKIKVRFWISYFIIKMLGVTAAKNI
jgi:hypothetical protein